MYTCIAFCCSFAHFAWPSLLYTLTLQTIVVHTLCLVQYNCMTSWTLNVWLFSSSILYIVSDDPHWSNVWFIVLRPKPVIWPNQYVKTCTDFLWAGGYVWRLLWGNVRRKISAHVDGEPCRGSACADTGARTPIGVTGNRGIAKLSLSSAPTGQN